jgi:uncharacterized protein (TIGR00661 family)
MDRFEHPRAVRARLGSSFVATRAVVRAKTPGCTHYVVTSFYAPRPRPRLAPSTTLVGPILRPAIEAARPTVGDHFVVYQTSSADPAVVRALSEVRARFVVYGRGERPGRPGANVEVRAFDEARFVDDLATSRGLIAHGGHTALAEAAVLGKPVLCFPLRHQGEQELNAAWLTELGIGLAGRRPTAGLIAEFVRWSERRRAPARIASGNAAARAAVDAVLGGLS